MESVYEDFVDRGEVVRIWGARCTRCDYMEVAGTEVLGLVREVAWR